MSADPAVLMLRQRLAAVQGWVTLDAYEARALLEALDGLEAECRKLRADLLRMGDRLHAAAEVIAARAMEQPAAPRCYVSGP